MVPALLAMAALAILGLTRSAPAAPAAPALPLGTGAGPAIPTTTLGAGSLADAVLRNPSAIQGLISALAANPALAAQLAQQAPALAQLAQAIAANPALAAQAIQLAQANPAIVAQLAQVLAANPQLAALAAQLISGGGASTPAGGLPGLALPPGTPAPAPGGSNPLQAITGLLGQLLGAAGGTPAAGTPATPMPVPAYTGASGDQVNAANGILGLLAQRPELRDGRYDATVQGLQARLGGVTADGRIGQQTLTRVATVLGPQALQNAITPGGSYQGSGIYQGGYTGAGIPGFGGITPGGAGTGPDLSGLFQTVAQAAGMGPGGGTPNTSGTATHGFEELARGFGL